MSLQKILIIENDAGVKALAYSTLGQRWALTFVKSGDDATRELVTHSYSMVVIDSSITDKHALEFGKELKNDKRFRNISMIFMVNEGETEQRILGLSVGADDSLFRTIEPREFVARIESNLRRSQQQYVNTSFSISNFRVDLLAQRCFLKRSDEGEIELVLTPIEFKFLVYFLKHENSIVSRQDLMNAVWGENIYITGSTIDTHISSLRKKLLVTNHSLQTLVKKGYLFSFVPLTI